MMTFYRYEKKIKAQSLTFHNPAARLSDELEAEYTDVRRAEQALAQRLHAHHRECDERRVAYEKEHGSGYPYFKCNCGTTFEHTKEYGKLVARLNALYFMREDIANEGVRAHYARGLQAWKAKEKWRKMKRNL